MPPSRTDNRRLTQRNLYSTVQLIDFEKPEQSRLLNLIGARYLEQSRQIGFPEKRESQGLLLLARCSGSDGSGQAAGAGDRLSLVAGFYPLQWGASRVRGRIEP